MTPAKYPFDAARSEILAGPDLFVDAIFGDLQSSFLLLPKSPAFVPYPDFQQSYEVLKRHTQGFAALDEDSIVSAIRENAIAFIKADTAAGIDSIRYFAAEGVPYAMLLYERFLGRPFAGYRDAVSELVGDVMESAVEAQLRSAGISYRKTARAEKIPGFDQESDFIVPNEWNPRIVIEAKISEDQRGR